MQENYAREKVEIDKQSDEVRHEIKMLSERLAGLKRAEIFRNTTEAMEREQKTINSLVNFTHDEGLVTMLRREYKALAAVFGDVTDELEELEDAMEK